ncbi:flagellar protein FliT [Dyella halodurans]|uniref:Flagellar protein FliT n=1 Tax=Dyella halodurans TaxID=1920171 RepID=A0ABV9C1H1_9GAMM|nr:flagellar protein FliT [Dyella halodurans]
MAGAVEPGDVLDVSAHMLASARAGAWDQVTTQSAERDRLLRLLPLADASAAETMKTLLAHNEEVKSLVAKARDDLGEALGQHRHSHRALNAYWHAAID